MAVHRTETYAQAMNRVLTGAVGRMVTAAMCQTSPHSQLRATMFERR